MGFPYCIVLNCKTFKKSIRVLIHLLFLQGQYSKFFFEYRKKSTKTKVIKGLQEFGVMRFVS